MISTFENFVPTNSDPYLAQLEHIAGFTTGKQQQYYQWLLANTQRVAELVSVRQFKKELGITAAWVKRNCQAKRCFMNATKVCDLHPDIRYVEGTLMIHGMIPTEHAWNSYHGHHFDVTAEFILNDAKDPHYQQLEYTYEELWRELDKTGEYGDLVRLHFINYVEKH